MTAPDEVMPISRRRQGTNVRQRQAQVGVRLTPTEIAALRQLADRERVTLPEALRRAFLRDVSQTA